MDLRPYSIPFLKTYKNGKTKLVKVRTIKWFDKPMRTIFVTKEGSYQAIEYTEFNPGSRQHIEKWLHDEYHYNFPYFTTKGNTKVDVDSLTNMEHEAGRLLKRYLKVSKDQSQVGGAEGSLLLNCDEKTSTVSSRVNTNGTVTGRFTSSSINLNKIPAQQEFRELFNAPVYYEIPDDLWNRISEYIKDFNENT